MKKENQCHVSEEKQIKIDNLTCKSVHNILRYRQQYPPPTAEKRLIELGFDSQEQKRIYSLPFQITREIKFQNEIIHNILYKMKKKKKFHIVLIAPVLSKLQCIYCAHVVVARWFGANLSIGITLSIRKKISALSEKEIVYVRVLKGWSSSSILNHLILTGKYFLYSNALKENIKFKFADYVNFVYEKSRVEKYILIMTNTQTAFVKKWHRFLE